MRIIVCLLLFAIGDSAYGDTFATIQLKTQRPAGTAATLVENPYLPGLPDLGHSAKYTVIADSSGCFTFRFEPNPYWWYHIEVADNSMMYGCFSAGDSIVVSPSGHWNLNVIYDKLGAYTEENKLYTFYGGKLSIRTLPERIECEQISGIQDSIKHEALRLNETTARLSHLYPEHVYFIRDLERWNRIYELSMSSAIAKRVEQYAPRECGTFCDSWLDTVNPQFERDRLNSYDYALIIGNIIEARLFRETARTADFSDSSKIAFRFHAAAAMTGVARTLGYLYLLVSSPTARPSVILPYLWAALDTIYQAKGNDPLAKESIELHIATLSNRTKGSRAYGFMLPDTAYKIHNLSEFQGKTVVAHFWGTWCGPCIEELQRDAQFEKNHHSDTNIVFVNIALEDHKYEKWKTFIRERNLKGYQLYAEGLWQSDVAQRFGINIVPSRVVIDGKGNIVDSILGVNYEFNDIENSIRVAQK